MEPLGRSLRAWPWAAGRGAAGEPWAGRPVPARLPGQGLVSARTRGSRSEEGALGSRRVGRGAEPSCARARDAVNCGGQLLLWSSGEGWRAVSGFRPLVLLFSVLEPWTGRGVGGMRANRPRARADELLVRSCSLRAHSTVDT